MRSKQALKNLISNMFLQIVVFISGIILPKFFLEAYGSSVNGMVTSITQFVTYMSLAEAGVGTASAVALYAPLAEGEEKRVNSILSATRLFYYRSGAIFMGLVIGLMIIYPYLIAGQQPEKTVRAMVFVLASSTLVDYLFLGKYKVLLTAMQRGYVVVNVQLVGTILNTVTTIILIYLRLDVVVVKAVATGIYILRFFIVRWYVKKQLPQINFKEEPDFGALKQRGAALLHQVVGIIVNNTDTVILTIMMGNRSLMEVSVYSIYNMVVYAINTMLTVFSNGLTAGFGEVISQNEQEVLKKSYSSFEYMYFIVFFVICNCMGGLLLPFVSIYTQNVADADYIRPVAAMLFVAIVFLQNIRVPGLTMICAAGHFKETQPQAIREAVINLVVSLLLVKKWGMVGVLCGTVASYGYRSIEIIIYNSKYIVKNCGKSSLQRIVRNIVASVIINVIGYKCIPNSMQSYITWMKYGVIIGTSNLILIVGINYLFERQEFWELMLRVKGLFRKKN